MFNRNIHHRVLPAAALGALAPSATAQYAVAWSALPCGGETTPAAAGQYALQSSIGQALSGPVGGSGGYALETGFLLAAEPGPACYANCDASVAPPTLNVADFTCFLQRYAAGDPYANCDSSVQAPTLNVADFTCFLQKYANGCQ